MAKLGEVCKVSPSTKNIERQGAWLLNLDMVEQQTGRVIEYKYVGEDDLNGSIIQFDTENVLYSKLRPNLNKVVLPQKDGFSTSELLPLRPDARVLNRDYLAVFLRSDSFVTWAVSKTAGAKMPRLGTKDLMNAEIPVPTIEQQKKIAEKFKKLEQLISLRKQQLAKLDELVKARFVEMFGTFPANPFRWSIGKIQDVVSDVRYGSSRPAVEGGKYPYLRMNNITYSGELDLRDTKQIDIPDSELDKCTVRRGDVLFNRTNSKELVGKTCVYNRDELMVLAGFVIRVRINERIRPEVLSAFLNMDFSKRMLIGMCKTAIGQANINAKELQNIDLYIPPIELQDQFVTLKNKIDQQKQTVQQSLEKLELLKKALMQEYFG